MGPTAGSSEAEWWFCTEDAPTPLLCDVQWWSAPDGTTTYEAPVCIGDSDVFLRLHAFDVALEQSAPSMNERFIAAPEPSQTVLLCVGVVALVVIARLRGSA
jgi:hypothetical protein